jgi:hypothetical protein
MPVRRVSALAGNAGKGWRRHDSLSVMHALRFRVHYAVYNAAAFLLRSLNFLTFKPSIVAWGEHNCNSDMAT